MTKFDTNGLTEWLAEDEASLRAYDKMGSQYALGHREFLERNIARLRAALESADSLGAAWKAPASEASVVAHGSDQLAQECARAICDQWIVMNFVGYEGDWIEATVDQVAERLKHILKSNNASSGR